MSEFAAIIPVWEAYCFECDWIAAGTFPCKSEALAAAEAHHKDAHGQEVQL